MRAESLQEWVDDLTNMFLRQMILGRRTEVCHSRRLRSCPALTIVDSPRVHHNDCRLIGAELVGHFDNTASVVGKTPGTNRKVGAGLINQNRCFITSCFDHGLYKFRMIVQQRGRVFQLIQHV